MKDYRPLKGNNTFNHFKYLCENPHCNTDEFGLCYQALSKKTLDLKDEKCTGGKHSKIRLSDIAAANMNGDKLPRFVIGKWSKPKCFKHVKKLPHPYQWQKKSWMYSQIFEEWVRELDDQFEKEAQHSTFRNRRIKIDR